MSGLTQRRQRPHRPADPAERRVFLANRLLILALLRHRAGRDGGPDLAAV